MATFSIPLAQNVDLVRDDGKWVLVTHGRIEIKQVLSNEELSNSLICPTSQALVLRIVETLTEFVDYELSPPNGMLADYQSPHAPACATCGEVLSCANCTFGDVLAENEPEAPREAISKEDESGVVWYLNEDGTWIEEKWVCRRCLDQGFVRDADERYSFGVYAGKYCDECWPKSGYRDATDPTAEFSELDAGERLDADY